MPTNAALILRQGSVRSGAWGLLILLCLSPNGSAAAQTPNRVDYRVQLSGEYVTVELCRPRTVPSRLVSGVPAASGAVRWFRSGPGFSDSTGTPLAIRDGRVELGNARCAHYQVDLAQAARATRFSRRSPEVTVTSAGAWLWRVPGRRRRGRVRFSAAPHVDIAVPWPRNPDGTYELDDSAFRNASFIAIGRFERWSFRRRDADFTVVRIGNGWLAPRSEIDAWLHEVIDGVASVPGRFPVERLLIVLSASPGASLGFGMVRRGGGHSIAFMVGRRARVDRLRRSWVGWHEMSHLLLPALPQRDAWFYEGVATYYQEVLRARAGIQSPSRAWGQLLAGFGRGRHHGRVRTLSDASTTMMQDGGFSRVYWSGTAFALEADLALRQRGESLDRAIARGVATWRGSNRTWSGPEVCEIFDRPLSDHPVVPMHRRYANSHDFPPIIDRRLAQIGVVRVAGRTRLVTAPGRAMRDAIMRPFNEAGETPARRSPSPPDSGSAGGEPGTTDPRR